MSGKSTSTIDRPETPPSAADRGRSRLGDLSRPISFDRRITHNRRSNMALALGALMIAGALAAAIFVLPVKTMFDQDDQIAERTDQLSATAGGQQRPAQRGRTTEDRRRDQGGGARATRFRRARRDPPVDPGPATRSHRPAERVAVQPDHRDRRRAHQPAGTRRRERIHCPGNAGDVCSGGRGPATTPATTPPARRPARRRLPRPEPDAPDAAGSDPCRRPGWIRCGPTSMSDDQGVHRWLEACSARRCSGRRTRSS